MGGPKSAGLKNKLFKKPNLSKMYKSINKMTEKKEKKSKEEVKTDKAEK